MAKKATSLHLEKRTWDLLRRVARERGLSASALCDEILREVVPRLAGKGPEFTFYTIELKPVRQFG